MKKRIKNRKSLKNNLKHIVKSYNHHSDEEDYLDYEILEKLEKDDFYKKKNDDQFDNNDEQH